MMRFVGFVAASVLALLPSAALAGPPAPVVTQFATNVYANLYGITSDKHGLYVTGSTGGFRSFTYDPGNGVIGKIPLTGGPVQTLYSSGNYPTSSGHVAPFQISMNGTNKLVWADPDAGPSTGASFMSGTTSGATATEFFGICCGPGVLPGDGVGIMVWGNDTYFSDATGGRIGKDPSGSTATQIGPTRYTPDFPTENWAQIAVSNGKIFIADSAQNRFVDSSGGGVTDVSASIAPGVHWISVDGTSGFQTLTTKIPNPQGIVAVNNTLYVTSGSTIWKVNELNGKTKVLVTDPRFLDLQGITYHKGALYVADSQNVFGPFVSGVSRITQDMPGVIWKVIP